MTTSMKKVIGLLALLLIPIVTFTGCRLEKTKAEVGQSSIFAPVIVNGL